ncbi:MAG TPA: YdeI/OmpD-associated family protein [Thermoanaerobaculia bacterium]|nr:YdeI/OmpD-associated family protein [Thermoanaerobaculia bacterium]
MKPRFFATADAFRDWLKNNHDKVDELLVGFYKRGSGKRSITWPESVDQALCFGWIDGVRKRIDDESYSIRFTPRRRGSIWSAVNIRRVKQLIEDAAMHPAGLKAFETRDEERANIYSYERAAASFSADQEKRFRANKSAWKFFSEQPAGYRRLMAHYVTSVKKEETRQRRLKKVIDASAQGKRLL